MLEALSGIRASATPDRDRGCWPVRAAVIYRQQMFCFAAGTQALGVDRRVDRGGQKVSDDGWVEATSCPSVGGGGGSFSASVLSG